MTREEILQVKSLSKRTERKARGQFVVEGVKNIDQVDQFGDEEDAEHDYDWQSPLFK